MINRNKLIILSILVVVALMIVTGCKNNESKIATNDTAIATRDTAITILKCTENITDKATENTIDKTTETIECTEMPTITEATTTTKTPTTQPVIHKTESATTEIKEESVVPIEKFSDNELDLVARTIYLEAGNCSEYCQWLVGSTILNLADRNGGIVNVTTNSNMFNVAPYLYSCTPSDLSYQVAQRVLSGDRDYSVMAFRANYYHNFGKPYTNIDNVYFSTY